jgi:DnaK suppressor protein
VESGIPLDEIDQANDMIEREMGYAMSDNMRQNLKEVDNAIEKLQSGDYGVCEGCHKPISEKRLKLLPFARYCVSCQESSESASK